MYENRSNRRLSPPWRKGLPSLDRLVEHPVAWHALFHGEQRPPSGLVDQRHVDPLFAFHQVQIGLDLGLGVVERHQEIAVGDLDRNAEQRAARRFLGILEREAQDALDAAAVEILRRYEDQLDGVAGGDRLVDIALDRHGQLQILAGDLRLGANRRLLRQIVAGRFLHQRPLDRAGFGRPLGNVGALLVVDRLLADRDGSVAGGGRRRSSGGRGCGRRNDRRPRPSSSALPGLSGRGRRPSGLRQLRPGQRQLPRGRPQPPPGRPVQGSPDRQPAGPDGAAGVGSRRWRLRGGGHRCALAQRGNAAGRTVVGLRPIAVQPLGELLGRVRGSRFIGGLPCRCRGRRSRRLTAGAVVTLLPPKPSITWKSSLLSQTA